MALTNRETAAAKLSQGKKQLKLHDMDGLFLLVNLSGKYWRLAYAYNGKRKTASFGTYPKVSLKEARKMNAEAHKLLAEGIDPTQHKKNIKYTGPLKWDSCLR